MLLRHRVLPILFALILIPALADQIIQDVRGDDAITQIPGNQIFPSGNLTNESSHQDLASWLNQSLGLNITGNPIEREALQGGSFSDAFNQTTISIPARDWVSFVSSEETLRLHYASSTSEFIGFDVHFIPPRYIGTTPLCDFTIDIANALGISLTNASYIQYSTSYYVNGGSNGTGPILSTLNIGSWREIHYSLPFHIVNQLTAWEDEKSHTVTHLRLYSWFDNIPSLNYSIGEVVHAASEASNRSFGLRPFFNYEIGLMPNYQNMTWSFLVSFSYSGPEGGELLVLLLDMETLDFQSIMMRAISTPSNNLFLGLSPVLAFLSVVILLTGTFLITISVAWFGHSDSGWMLSMVTFFLPLYIRLKRESILDHFLRGRIVEYVSSNPGVTFSQIRDRLDATNGTLNYHLWILSKTGFLHSIKEGKFIRYYAEGSARQWNAMLSPFQYSLLQRIVTSKSINLRKLAIDMDCSKQRIHHNIKRLERLSLVKINKHNGMQVISLSQVGVDLLNDLNDQVTS